MTARREDISTLPNWPRGLSREQAAAYLGVSAETFRRHVGIAPRRIGTRCVWDRLDLDIWFDIAQTQSRILHAKYEGGRVAGYAARPNSSDPVRSSL